MRMTKPDIMSAIDMMTFMIGPQVSEELGLQSKLQDLPFFGIPPWGKAKRTKYLNIWYSQDTGQGDMVQILIVVRVQKFNYNGVKFFYVNKYGIQETNPERLRKVIEQEKEDKKSGKVEKRTITNDGFYSVDWVNGTYVDFICPQCGESVKECLCVECPDCGEECPPISAVKGVDEEVFFYCKGCERKFYVEALQERLAIMWLQSHQELEHLKCPLCSKVLEPILDSEQSGGMQLFCKECDLTQNTPDWVLKEYEKAERERDEKLKDKRKEAEHITRQRGD